jgi:hypothetical protein
MLILKYQNGLIKVLAGSSYLLICTECTTTWCALETDSNYGNIFSIWDRLLGTYNSTPMSEITYGLDVLDNSKDESLSYQLKVPFNKNIKTDY